MTYALMACLQSKQPLPQPGACLACFGPGREDSQSHVGLLDAAPVKLLLALQASKYMLLVAAGWVVAENLKLEG